jgi:cyclopropane-fatty-acyl-phospholipid synthase
VGKQAIFLESSPAGASPEAIGFHYDIGTEFFKSWLGDELIYSAARWSEPLATSRRPATLEFAQAAKLDFHLNAVGAGGGQSLLDIGFGWGGLIRRAIRVFDVAEAHGITLSAEQFAYVRAQNLPRTKLRLESYETLSLARPVDGIVSIGAFEHFSKPGLDRRAKLAVYGGFFERCHSFLKPGARLSLQSSFWAGIERSRAAEIVPSGVFPESDLPYLDEILESAERRFRVLYLETSENDYTRTLCEWLKRLRCAHDRALVDDTKFAFHEDYLRRCIVGFKRHRIRLARIVFERTSAFTAATTNAMVNKV